MTFTELKKNGALICEVDFAHNGVYAGTDYYYICNKDLYCRTEPTNAFNYDGETKTFLAVANIKENIGETLAFNSELFDKVCEYFGEDRNLYNC